MVGAAPCRPAARDPARTVTGPGHRRRRGGPRPVAGRADRRSALAGLGAAAGPRPCRLATRPPDRGHARCGPAPVEPAYRPGERGVVGVTASAGSCGPRFVGAVDPPKPPAADGHHPLVAADLVARRGRLGPTDRIGIGGALETGGKARTKSGAGLPPALGAMSAAPMVRFDGFGRLGVLLAATPPSPRARPRRSALSRRRPRPPRRASRRWRRHGPQGGRPPPRRQRPPFGHGTRSDARGRAMRETRARRRDGGRGRGWAGSWPPPPNGGLGPPPPHAA